jgi:hypothetical protein
MMRAARVVVVAVAACAGATPPTATPVGATPASATPAAPALTVAAAPSPSCAAPEFRQLDFWIGDWDVAVHARSSATATQWGDAKGHQHVEAILGGCAIAEHFRADGPPTPWAGASYSMWQPQLGKWRQTWVDDSAGFLVFKGGPEANGFVLYGEPKDVAGAKTQMRMVFSAITPTSLHWEWQQSSDGWATVAPLMQVDYRRAAVASRP